MNRRVMNQPSLGSLLGVIVVPAGFDAHTPLLGLSPLLRHALAMQAAGCGRVALRGADVDATALAADPRLVIPLVRVIADHDVALVVRADVTTHRLIPARLAQALRAGLAVEASEVVRVGDRHAGYYGCTGDRTAGLAAALEAEHASDADRSLPLVAGVSPEFVVRADTAAERRRATWRHLVSLRKPTSGYFERLYMRPMAMFITWPLANTRVTPNAMSVVTFAFGVASAVMVAMPDTRWNVAGALLHLFMRVVDCVDGELARLRYQCSALGAWLDSVCDGVSMAAFVGAVGYRLDTLGSPYAVVGYVGAAAWMGVQLLEWRGAYLAGTGGSVQTIEWGHRSEQARPLERLVARLELLMRIDAISTYYGVAVLMGALVPLVMAHCVMSVLAIAYYVGQLRRIRRPA